MNKLTLNFYNSATLQVAKNLLGKIIHFYGKKIIINETEAYIGQDDPACHAAKGLTARTEVMFGRAGVSYVYLIYGMHYCLNFVTEAENFPAAVLIRGGYCPITNQYINGPGRLCKHLGITKNHNKIDIVNNEHFFLTEGIIVLPEAIHQTSRIGISQGLGACRESI